MQLIPRYRFLLRELVRRDIEQRYRGSALGILWTVFDPAWQLLLYTFVFSAVLRVGLPGEATDSFPIFLFAGLLAWTPVRQGIERGTTAIVDSGALVKNHAYPPVLFVVAVVVAEVIHGLVATLVFVVALLAIGAAQFSAAPLLLIAVPAQAALAFGAALLASAAHVYARDTVRAVVLLLNAWFFLTPIVYPLALVPERWRWILEINPLAGLVELYRVALLGGAPRTAPLVALATGTALVLVAGWRTTRRLAPHYVDEI